MAVWGGLANSCDKKKSKSKGEKERYTHLNAELQRIERRDKKTFLSDQWKGKEENNRMGKIRDLFKKIRDTKGIFHAKMGTIKDRSGMDLKSRCDVICSAYDVIHIVAVMSSIHWVWYNWYSGCDDTDTVGVMSEIMAVNLHNGCVLITLCVIPYKVDMS